MQRIEDVRKIFMEALLVLHSYNEARSITNWVLQEILETSTANLLLQSEIPLTPLQENKLLSVLQRLKQAEPVQYIFGFTYFGGLKLKVTPDVLIPRPETEEMVQKIAAITDDEPSAILDIGTGSGCIPITLKAVFPLAEIHALDISPGALAVAKENADFHKREVIFHQVNILESKEREQLPKFDLIVSNPPYVTRKEQKQLHPNVTHYEPALALFVSNEDPFLFYKAICGLAETNLQPGGTIWFEVNAFLAGELSAEIKKRYDFEEIRIEEDLSGKQRFLILRKRKNGT